ncbi:MAG: hypothetical protein ACI9OJ_004408, partial [Myxococcota bacterium]
SDEQPCTQGVCAESACVCAPGLMDCPCDEEGLCIFGGSCEDALCVPCTPGTLDCTCGENDECELGSTCDEKLAGAGSDTATTYCRAYWTCAICLEHQQCDEGAGEDATCLEVCDEGWTWNAPTGACEPIVPINCGDGEASILESCNALNKACVPGEGTAECGDCLPNFVDEDGALETCRAAYTCQSLGCAAANKLCTGATTTTDAACTECGEFFVVDEADANQCRAVLTCEGLGCAAANKACIPQGKATDATCGGCLPGFAVEPDGVSCAALATCDIVGCAALNRTCIQEPDIAAVCGDCAVGFIIDEENSEQCRAIQTCTDQGCDDLNRNCMGATEAADAECSICKSFFSGSDDVSTACTALTACSALDCGASFKVCNSASPTEAATCGGCAPGYVTDGADGCKIPDANCNPGTPGSIVPDCAQSNQDCVNPNDQPAVCGACIAGFSQDTNEKCAPITTCVSLDCAGKSRKCEGTPPFQTCGECLEGTVENPVDETVCVSPSTCATLTCPDGVGVDGPIPMFCIEATIGGTASCHPNGCPEDEAYSDWTGKCEACQVNCGDAFGETGDIWPFTRVDSKECLCETKPGYYWDPSGGKTAVPCDADGDGWVRRDAENYINDESAVHLQQNARCTVRTIDRFVLQNELGQRLAILLCDEEPNGELLLLRQDQAPPNGKCEYPHYVDLYETVRNDSQSDLESATLAVNYATGGVGRQLLASEINGLTRACTLGGDYNHNGLTDIKEWHGMPKGNLGPVENVFARFSFFVELHQSYYEIGAESLAVGQYVIAERSRCNLDFPLKGQSLAQPGPDSCVDNCGTNAEADCWCDPLCEGYGDCCDNKVQVCGAEDGATDGAGEGYWRQCTRSRDIAYNATDANADFGLDFAGWSCDAQSGRCAVPPPPTNAVAVSDPPVHGLCDMPADFSDERCNDPDHPWLCVNGSVWRGMSHHSQFRCVVADPNPSLEEPHLAPNDLGGGLSDYEFVECGVACPADDPDCANDCMPGLPGEVDVSCAASSTGTVGGVGKTSQSPVFSCSASVGPPSLGAVGFAISAFKKGKIYQRGCIDEWLPKGVDDGKSVFGEDDPEIAAWRELCPGYVNAPSAIDGQSDQVNYGAVQCGCGNNFGGEGCQTGCPDNQLGNMTGYDAKLREGFWMCGHTSSTGSVSQHPTYGADMVTGKWRMRGEVQLAPTDRKPMTSGKWTIR